MRHTCQRSRDGSSEYLCLSRLRLRRSLSLAPSSYWCCSTRALWVCGGWCVVCQGDVDECQRCVQVKSAPSVVNMPRLEQQDVHHHHQQQPRLQASFLPCHPSRYKGWACRALHMGAACSQQRGAYAGAYPVAAGKHVHAVLLLLTNTLGSSVKHRMRFVPAAFCPC